MANTSVRLQQDPNNSGGLVMAGNPSANGANACYLRNGDSLTLSIDTSSLPATAKFISIDFYPNGNERSADVASIGFNTLNSPRSLLGYQTSGPSAPAISLLSVSWNTSDLTKPITLTDSDDDSADDPVWFAINVQDATSGRSWRLDPEIVNTGGSKSGWQPGEAASLNRVAVAAAVMSEADLVVPRPQPVGGSGSGSTSKGKGKGKSDGKSKGKGKSKDDGKGKGGGKSKGGAKGKGGAKSKSKSKGGAKTKSKSKKVARAATGRATARKSARKVVRKAASKAAKRTKRASGRSAR